MLFFTPKSLTSACITCHFRKTLCASAWSRAWRCSQEFRHLFWLFCKKHHIVSFCAPTSRLFQNTQCVRFSIQKDNKKLKSVRYLIYLIFGIKKKCTHWTFIIDRVFSISSRKILIYIYFFNQPIQCLLPSAQDGCHKSLSEPSQNNFTSTLLQFLRDRNVSVFACHGDLSLIQCICS